MADLNVALEFVFYNACANLTRKQTTFINLASSPPPDLILAAGTTSLKNPHILLDPGLGQTRSQMSMSTLENLESTKRYSTVFSEGEEVTAQTSMVSVEQDCGIEYVQRTKYESWEIMTAVLVLTSLHDFFFSPLLRRSGRMDCDSFGWRLNLNHSPFAWPFSVICISSDRGQVSSWA